MQVHTELAECFSFTQGLLVLYYSNDILSKSLPSLGPYLSLGITIVNVIMTFPAIILIEVSCCPCSVFNIHLLTRSLANGQEALTNPFSSWLHHLSLPPWLWLEQRLSYAFEHHHRVLYNVRYLAISHPHRGSTVN